MKHNRQTNIISRRTTSIEERGKKRRTKQGNTNKHNIIRNLKDDFKHKRSTNWLWNWFLTRGYNKNKLWKELCDIIVKTIILIQAPVSQGVKGCKINGLNKNPFTCFEVVFVVFIFVIIVQSMMIQ